MGLLHCTMPEALHMIVCLIAGTAKDYNYIVLHYGGISV